jgi:hypothetical protein
MNRAEMAVAFGRRCGFASGRRLGATGPRMESYNWKAKPISPCLEAHEAHPKTTLCGVVFQKLNGPLLTSAAIAAGNCLVVVPRSDGVNLAESAKPL